MQADNLQLCQTKFTHVMRKHGKSGTKTLFYLRKYTPNEISDAKFGHLRKEIEVEGVKLYIFAPTMTQHVQRHAYCLLGGKWIISFSGSLQILCHNADNIHDGVRVKFKFYTNVIGTKCKERILSVPHEPLTPQTFPILQISI